MAMNLCFCSKTRIYVNDFFFRFLLTFLVFLFFCLIVFLFSILSLYSILFSVCVFLSFFFYNSSQLWTKLSRKNTSVRAALNNGNFFQDNFITILVQYLKKLLLNCHTTIIPISMDLHRKSKSQNYYFFFFKTEEKEEGRKGQISVTNKKKEFRVLKKEERRKKSEWTKMSLFHSKEICWDQQAWR